MDSLDLLAREDEFKKLNKQLEKKTESLMKEIENVMQKPDFFTEFSHNLSITPHSTPKRHQCPTPPQITTPKPVLRRKPLKSTKQITVDESQNVEVSLIDVGVMEKGDEKCENRVVCDCCDHSKVKTDDEQFLQAFVSVGVQEKVFPQSFLKDNISIESICKFLSTKVKLMQEQIDKLQTNIDKKAIQCKSHLTQLAELEGERLTLLSKNNSLRASAADAKAKWMAVENRLGVTYNTFESSLNTMQSDSTSGSEPISTEKTPEKDRLYKEQRSESDRLSCELKRLKCELTGVNSRHAAQADTVSTLTQQLKASKAEYAEFRESTRQLAISHQQAIATLEGRISAYISTTDKQTALIDNLRRQNATLAAERALAAIETNYWELLSKDVK